MQASKTKRRWQNANKKNELIAKYHEWNGRPAPIFDIVPIDDESIDDNNEDLRTCKI